MTLLPIKIFTLCLLLYPFIYTKATDRKDHSALTQTAAKGQLKIGHDRDLRTIHILNDFIAPSVKKFLIQEDIDSEKLVNILFDENVQRPVSQANISQRTTFLAEPLSDNEGITKLPFYRPMIYQIQEIKKRFYMVLYSPQTPQRILFEEKCQRANDWYLAVVSTDVPRETLQLHTSAKLLVPINYMLNQWDTIQTHLSLKGQNLIRSDYSNREWNTIFSKKANDKDIQIDITFSGNRRAKTNAKDNRLAFTLNGQLKNWMFGDFSRKLDEVGNQANISIKRCVRRIAKATSDNNKLEIERVTQENKLLIRLSFDQRTVIVPEVELYSIYYQDGIWKENKIAKIDLNAETEANQFSGVYISRNTGFTAMHGSKIKVVYTGNPHVPPLSTWINYAFH